MGKERVTDKPEPEPNPNIPSFQAEPREGQESTLACHCEEHRG